MSDSECIHGLDLTTPSSCGFAVDVPDERCSPNETVPPERPQPRSCVRLVQDEEAS